MTSQDWIARHPYLQPVADLQAAVEGVVASLDVPDAPLPAWNDYSADYRAGVPVLHSRHCVVDVAALDAALHTLVEALATTMTLAPIGERCRELARCANLEESPESGLLHYLRWAVLSRHAQPVVRAFEQWRDEEQWLRKYCPVCGGLPAMAQLIGKDPGRIRLLSCGCCRARWRYRRTGCPFCEPADDHRLAVIAVDGEPGLRIDYCAHCGGYLKTYDGEGNERLLLADWTSLHLDFVARGRGLKRLAGSLYDV